MAGDGEAVDGEKGRKKKEGRKEGKKILIGALRERSYLGKAGKMEVKKENISVLCERWGRRERWK